MAFHTVMSAVDTISESDEFSRHILCMKLTSHEKTAIWRRSPIFGGKKH